VLYKVRWLPAWSLSYSGRYKLLQSLRTFSFKKWHIHVISECGNVIEDGSTDAYRGRWHVNHLKVFIVRPPGMGIPSADWRDIARIKERDVKDRKASAPAARAPLVVDMSVNKRKFDAVAAVPTSHRKTSSKDKLRDGLGG
jgi:hypothetical protein